MKWDVKAWYHGRAGPTAQHPANWQQAHLVMREHAPTSDTTCDTCHDLTCTRAVMEVIMWCFITSSEQASSCNDSHNTILIKVEQQIIWAQIHRYRLKIYPKMCHKIILRQKLHCRKIILWHILGSWARLS